MSLIKSNDLWIQEGDHYRHYFVDVSQELVVYFRSSHHHH